MEQDSYSRKLLARGRCDLSIDAHIGGRNLHPVRHTTLDFPNDWVREQADLWERGSVAAPKAECRRSVRSAKLEWQREDPWAKRNLGQHFIH